MLFLAYHTALHPLQTAVFCPFVKLDFVLVFGIPGYPGYPLQAAVFCSFLKRDFSVVYTFIRVGSTALDPSWPLRP